MAYYDHANKKGLESHTERRFIMVTKEDRIKLAEAIVKIWNNNPTLKQKRAVLEQMHAVYGLDREGLANIEKLLVPTKHPRAKLLYQAAA
jgi:hypothetical protein